MTHSKERNKVVETSPREAQAMDLLKTKTNCPKYVSRAQRKYKEEKKKGNIKKIRVSTIRNYKKELNNFQS